MSEGDNFWRKYTEAYDSIIGNFTKHGDLVELHAKKLDSHVKVLESGCGPGHLTKNLLDKQHEVYALDINQDSLKILRERCGNTRRLEIICADANYLPFADNSYDAISSMLVLWAIKDPTKYLKEHRRVLKKGGRLVLSGPSPQAKKDAPLILKQLKKDLKERGRFNSNAWQEFLDYTSTNIAEVGENWFTDNEIVKLLEKTGYQVCSIEANPIYFGRGHVVTAIKN